jgi:hypothetical protein
MADERDLELLDDYITNRMDAQDRDAFEQKLQADHDLQHEYALQQRLIKGIRDARVSELKSMLNQVAIPAHHTGTAVASKILIVAFVTILIGATAWFLTRDGMRSAEPEPTEQKVATEQPAADDSEPAELPQTAKKDAPVSGKQIVETDKNQTSAGTEHSKPSLAKKPEPLQAPGEKSTTTADAGISALQVETQSGNSRYAFHYQFKDHILVLYGPFAENQYEIIDLASAESGRIFLRFNERYYTLETADSTVRPLIAVTDTLLLAALSEHRRHQ